MHITGEKAISIDGDDIDCAVGGRRASNTLRTCDFFISPKKLDRMLIYSRSLIAAIDWLIGFEEFNSNRWCEKWNEINFSLVVA